MEDKNSKELYLCTDDTSNCDAIEYLPLTEDMKKKADKIKKDLDRAFSAGEFDVV